MNTLNNIKIRTKLLISFLLVAIMILVVAFAGLSSISATNERIKKMYQNQLLPYGYLASIRSETKTIKQEEIAIVLHSADRAKHEARIAQGWATLKGLEQDFRKHELTAAETADFEAYLQANQAFMADIQQTLAATGKGGKAAKGSPDSEAIFQKVMANILTTLQHNTQRGEALAKESESAYSAAKAYMLGLALIGLVFAVGVGLIISNSISKPLQKVVTLLKDVSRGDLSTRMNMNRRDEVGELAMTLDGLVEDLRANVFGILKKMASGDMSSTIASRGKTDEMTPAIMTISQTLTELVGEMKSMSALHDAGDIDARMPGDRFQGDFRTMADGVNQMVAGHVEVKKKAMACVSEFGKGNFEAPLERFPGKKAFINDTIEQVRTNLRALMVDTEMLVKAAIEGKLTTRADASKHHGDFRKIVQGIDDTLDAVIGPLQTTAEYVDSISKGVIPARIDRQYNGDFNLIKTNLNNCIDGLGGLVEANQVLQRMASNDLTGRVEGKYLGIFAEVAKAINVTVTNQANVLMSIQQNAETLAQSSEGLTTSSSTMANNSEAMTAQAHTAAAATEQASASVKSMAAGIEQVSANSQSVAGASQQVAMNLNAVGTSVEHMSTTMKTAAATSESVTSAVNSVAAAIEEMSASLNEVSKNTGQAARVSGRAAKSATSTAAIVNNLGESAVEIGKVVEMIKGIAAQTNLLALNATIEAASAGEAGKGFAVVANEVKALAKQTASATEDIRKQVSAMQSNTTDAVKAIEEIVTVINEINGISSTIAAAVEEQTATTNEIAKNVGDAARGAAELSRNVNESSQSASAISTNVQEAARGVNEITRNINQLATGANDVARNAGEAAKGMSEVAQNVAIVSDRSNQTTRGAAETNASALALGRLAESLQHAVTSFRIM